MVQRKRTFTLGAATSVEDGNAGAESIEDGNAGAVSVCGDGEEILDVDCMKPANMALQIEQAKATLYMAGIGCTGWIVTRPTATKGAMVLTAGHCGSYDPETFVFDYDLTCGTTTGAPQTKSCTGTVLAREDPLDDYTVYELDKTCPYTNGVNPF